MGRQKSVRITIPRALQAPVPVYPFEWFSRGGIPPQAQTGYDPNFRWNAVTGATAANVTEYDLELRQPRHDYSPGECETGTVLARMAVPNASLRFPFALLPVTLAGATPYCFRVRGTTRDGEIGPFSPWVMFKIGGPGVLRIDPKRFDARHLSMMLNCAVIKQHAFSNTIVDCPSGDARPVSTGTVTPPAPDIVAPTTPNVVYEVQLRYDGLGRLSEVRHPDPDTSWSANSRQGSWQRFTYNAQRGQNSVTYQRAADNQPIDLFSGATYDAWGMRGRTAPLRDFDLQGTAVTVQEDRTYDNLGRLNSLGLNNGGANYYNANNMQYNDWGFLQSQSRNDQALSGSMLYGYNSPLGRLTDFTIGGQKAIYNYDDAGNLTGIQQPGIAVTGLPLYPSGPNSARLDLAPFQGASYDANNHRAGWQYDTNGRVTQDDHFRYAYNELDQLSEVRDGTWVLAQYLYDADGRRVREVSDSRIIYFARGPGGQLLTQETHYPWGNDQRLPERRDFIYHNGLALAEMVWIANTPVYPNYHFRDRLGNPVVSLGGNDGFVPRFAEYEPYGQQMRTLSAAKDVIHEFTGHERDEVSGLDYMMQRYYEPKYGRFTRPDPKLEIRASDPTAFNMYAYVQGNPVNYVDTKGTSPEDIRQVVQWLQNNYPELFPKWQVTITEGDPGEGNTGITERISGDIIVRSDLSRAQLAETIGHELFHARQSLIYRIGEAVRLSAAKLGIGGGELEHGAKTIAGLAIKSHYEAEQQASQSVRPTATFSNPILFFLPDGGFGLAYSLKDYE
jgi:RHS repeat-associated protein